MFLCGLHLIFGTHVSSSSIRSFIQRMRAHIYNTRGGVLAGENIICFSMDNLLTSTNIKYQNGDGRSVSYLHATVRNVKRIVECTLPDCEQIKNFKTELDHLSQKIVAPWHFPCFSDGLSLSIQTKDYNLLSKVSSYSDLMESNKNVEAYLKLVSKCIGLKMVDQTISTNFFVHPVSGIEGDSATNHSHRHTMMHMFARLSRTGLINDAKSFQSSVVNSYNKNASEKVTSCSYL